MLKGIFITLEGGDGCGKSTHARLLKEFLDQEGIAAVLTEEPGGTPLGEEIKALLLDHKFGKIAPTTELLLFAAQRAEHVEKVIQPQLEAGNCVISSRFADATYVYQGIARNLDLSLISRLADVTTGGLKPDKTFLLDVDPERGLERSKETDKSTAPKGTTDKIESEGLVFQKKVRQGYLDLAKLEPNRFVILSTEDELNVVQEKIRKQVKELILTHKQI